MECSLTSVFYDILKILGHTSSELYGNEVDLVSEEKNKDSKSKTAQTTQLLRSRRTKLVEKYNMLCRNIYAVFPLYLSYLEHHGLVCVHRSCVFYYNENSKQTDRQTDRQTDGFSALYSRFVSCHQSVCICVSFEVKGKDKLISLLKYKLLINTFPLVQLQSTP